MTAPSRLPVLPVAALLLLAAAGCGPSAKPEPGRRLRTLGGQAGSGPGEFGYISDAIQDSDGFYYVAEFGDNSRITKLDPSGKFVLSWGSAGEEPGQFARLRALALGPDGLLYAA